MPPPGELPVPDVATAVVGWRGWKVTGTDDPVLVSPLRGGEWPAREAMVARCGEHPPPGEGCGCGLYAVTDLRQAVTASGAAVVGCVALWGRIVEGSLGWRAEKAYPRLLLADASVDHRTCRHLTRRYGVPVRRLPGGLTELTSTVGEEVDEAVRDLRCAVEAAVRSEVPERPLDDVVSDLFREIAVENRLAAHRRLLDDSRRSIRESTRLSVGVASATVILTVILILLVWLFPPSGSLPAVALLPSADVLAVPLEIAGGVAVTPDGARVYVTHYFGQASRPGDTVSVVDPAARALVGTVKVGPTPQGVAVSPDGRRAYVASNGAGAPGTVSVIDTATGTVAAMVQVGTGAGQVAVSPDSRRAYVTSTSGLSVLDTATATVAATVPVPGAASVAVSPDGGRAYVIGASGVAVVDTARNTVVGTVDVGPGPQSIVVAPDGRLAYVAVDGGNPTQAGTIAVIDTASARLVRTVGGAPPRVFATAVTPDGSRLLVTGRAGGTVTAIDVAAGTITANVVVGGDAYDIALAPDGRHAYVVSGDRLWLVTFP